LEAMRSLADPPRGVDNHAEEVVSRVTHATTGLVAQREESAALRHGVTKPGPILPRSTPNGPVPRKEGGSGAVPWVSTDDSPNIRDDAAEGPGDGHVRPLAGMQHQVAHFFATRQASHPGKHQPNLNQWAVPQACACRKRALAPQHAAPKLVHRVQRLISAALAGRLLVTARASMNLNPRYMTDGKEGSTNDAHCEGLDWAGLDRQ